MKFLPSRDLATVCAVTDERVNKTLTFGRDLDLHGATVAGCRGSTVLLAMCTLGGQGNLFAHTSLWEVALYY